MYVVSLHGGLRVGGLAVGGVDMLVVDCVAVLALGVAGVAASVFDVAGGTGGD